MKTNIKTKAFSLTAVAIAVYLLASPAYATCGVNGYWGSECGPQTPAPTIPGNTTNTVTGGDSNSTATGPERGGIQSDRGASRAARRASAPDASPAVSDKERDE